MSSLAFMKYSGERVGRPLQVLIIANNATIESESLNLVILSFFGRL